MTNSKALTISLGVLALAASACSKGQQCTPNAAECAGDRAVLTCPSDGSAWATYTCAAWEKCTGGVCKAVDGIDVACTPGAATCVNDRVLSVCVAAGIAPSIVACHENESCKDGVCVTNATCTAGATECVSPSLMRTCAADGKSWVASACASTESCLATANACARRTDVACTSADNACVNGVPFVCKKDGTGFDTTACPANTHCVQDGRCQGNSATGCIAGSSSCSGDMAVSCSADGKTTTYLQCAVGHACVVDSATKAASCKQLVCSPGARVCGNPTDPNADTTAFVSTCKSDGSGWAVARCETNSLCDGGVCEFDCLPGTTACSDNSIVTCSASGQWELASVNHCTENELCQHYPDGLTRCEDILCAFTANVGLCYGATHFAACKDGHLQLPVPCPGGCTGSECFGGCEDAETRCGITSSGAIADAVEGCASGQWEPLDQATACNDAGGSATPKVCIQLSELPGAHKAVCGDPECKNFGQICTADGKVRKCKDGLLGAEEACPAGLVCTNAVLGCYLPTCSDGETLCIDDLNGGLGFRKCVGGKWSETYESCGRTATGVFKVCHDTTGADGKRLAACYDPTACTPGARRCAKDGGVQTCDADGAWGVSIPCTIGSCEGVDATCTAQCKPSETICGGVPTSLYGQTAWSKAGKCSTAGRVPDWSTVSDCAVGTYCREDPSGAALGCVECQGSATGNGYVDTRCYAAAPFLVQFCGTGNTWSSGASLTIDCGSMACANATSYEPARCLEP